MTKSVYDLTITTGFDGAPTIRGTFTLDGNSASGIARLTQAVNPPINTPAMFPEGHGVLVANTLTLFLSGVSLSASFPIPFVSALGILATIDGTAVSGKASFTYYANGASHRLTDVPVTGNVLTLG
ncbi:MULTISPECIES: DUF1842 domain-containing protein [Azospirillaceae]|uniref:DUF1842 domain-containing protein n=1 Tax=Azospirillaceae TaxID=2829815 RepID=UPI000B6DE7F8|nr:MULTISPECIES: DUF1842 domain-containing protein [Azospirillaceae]MDG5496888.1 DUF1842 domain-containing protein [Niveispirillum sp. BGYR6]SNR89224.1 protein of unknown function [Azospirillum sp. RU38E]SNS05345.1 protein of unknown function [Azospirillum sp. RU37A]